MFSLISIAAEQHPEQHSGQSRSNERTTTTHSCSNSRANFEATLEQLWISSTQYRFLDSPSKLHRLSIDQTINCSSIDHQSNNPQGTSTNCNPHEFQRNFPAQSRLCLPTSSQPVRSVVCKFVKFQSKLRETGRRISRGSSASLMGKEARSLSAVARAGAASDGQPASWAFDGWTV